MFSLLGSVTAQASLCSACWFQSLHRPVCVQPARKCRTRFSFDGSYFKLFHFFAFSTEDAERRPNLPANDKISIKPLPWWKPCGRRCCDTRKTRIRLGNIAPGVYNGLPGWVTVLQPPTTTGNVGSSACNKRALLKVSEESLQGYT